MSNSLRYCANWYARQRRRTREVLVGDVGIGGSNPVRVQSMLTSDTRDVEACFAEALKLAEVGCELVRITAQTKMFATYLEALREKLRKAKCNVPLIADIHFKPDAALEAVNWVDKVRVNPGNFADRKKFEQKEYTDEEYEQEIQRIREAFFPLVRRCKDLGRAIRLGTNHGSLSDRIMNRYGDTPLGMVESAFEFARVCRDEGFHDFIFSMKASNPKVMIAAYRLLAARMEEEKWDYPLHLGVTEAGSGEDGRVKSAVGIGSLLADGLGDTIRVSLTEDPVFEIPVAQQLVQIFKNDTFLLQEKDYPQGFHPFVFQRRKSELKSLNNLPFGLGHPPRIVARKAEMKEMKIDEDLKIEFAIEDLPLCVVDPRDSEKCQQLDSSAPLLLSVADGLDIDPIHAFRLLAFRFSEKHQILLKDTLNPDETSDLDLLKSSARLGALLCDGIGDLLWLRLGKSSDERLHLAYTIAQACGSRLFQADYVSCPSCGRTLFDLQTTTQRVQSATKHLKGVRIAVMGCIVNGPGEMADADFGYVGGAPGKINLYVGKEPVRFHIPEKEAVLQLVDLIKEHNRWVDSK